MSNQAGGPSRKLRLQGWRSGNEALSHIIGLSLQKIRKYVTRAKASQSARLLRGLVKVPSGT